MTQPTKDTAPRRVAVVGGGCVGTSFIYHLLQAASRAGTPSFELTVFDDRGLGPGEPYQQDSDCILLNSPGNYSSAVADDPTHFSKWVERQGIASADDAARQYFPRALYGRYLSDLSARNTTVAVEAGCGFRHVARKVVAMRSIGQQLQVLDTGAGSHCFDHVVLSMGNLESQAFAQFARCERFINDPYPTTKLARKIPAEASVLVIGTSLSALDTIIGLADSGHKGPIHASSRSGRMPVVRGSAFAPVDMRHFTAQNIGALAAAKAGLMTVADLQELLLADFRENGGTLVDAQDAFRQVGDASRYLDEEILAATSGPRLWISVSAAMMSCIEDVWALLPRDERRAFLKRFQRDWKMRKISFPLVNALKVRELLQSGRITIGSSMRRLDRPKPQAGFQLTEGDGASGRMRCFDYVVNGTGFSSSVEDCADPLIRDLLTSGLAAPDALGGLRVNPATGLLLGKDGVEQKITPLGTLASGAYFWTNSIDVNVRVAARHAKGLVNSWQEVGKSA